MRHGIPWNPEVFSLTNEREVKPSQPGAICEVSESKSDSESSMTASDWIGAFKGPNVCTQRFSHFSPLHLRLTLIREQPNLWVPG